jgi:NAD(P)-dependent dehydrogenase (short-subunit alcohol dehydrogenase family)
MPHHAEKRPEIEITLEAAGRLWMAGVELDWKGVHADSSPRRVPLPTYPFERKRFWVDAAPETATKQDGASRRSSDVRDWLYSSTWTRDDTVVGAPRLDGTWLVVGVGPLVEATARRLKDAGASPVLVEPGGSFERVEASRFRVPVESAENMRRVISDLRDSGRPVAGALHLLAIPEQTGAAPPLLGPSHGEGQLAAPVRCHHSIVALAEAVSQTGGGRVRLIIGTSGAARVLGERVRHPEAALVLGPVLCLPLEAQDLMLRSVDVALGDPAQVHVAAGELVEEAAIEDAEVIVARRAGCRWLSRCARAPLPSAELSSLPLRERGVYWITGGLGGIGLAVARWLAFRTSARLLLTSRAALPPEEAWDRWIADHPANDRIAAAIRGIREIRAAGGEVLALAVDVADEVAMRRALDQARARWGAVHGVFHGAGVPGNGRLAFLKSPEDVRAVLSPKVDGLSVLVRLLGDTPLDLVVLLSSFNSVLGAPGLSDYCAANAFLDAFVDSEQSPPAWKQVVATDWGPWREAGMAQRIAEADARKKDDFESLSISTEMALEALQRILASRRRRVMISPLDPVSMYANATERMRAQAVPSSEADKTARSAPGRQDRDASTPADALATDVEQRVRMIWSEMLGVEEIGEHDDFFALGGHSLMATRVLARIAQVFNVRLSLRDMFDAPTLHLLSAKVKATAAPSATTPASPEVEREEIEF